MHLTRFQRNILSLSEPRDEEKFFITSPDFRSLNTLSFVSCYVGVENSNLIFTSNSCIGMIHQKKSVLFDRKSILLSTISVSSCFSVFSQI